MKPNIIYSFYQEDTINGGYKSGFQYETKKIQTEPRHNFFKKVKFSNIPDKYKLHDKYNNRKQTHQKYLKNINVY